MQISQNTLKILKNFNGLNPNIAISPGNTIRTIAKEGTATLAMAFVEEEFPTPFAVSNLSKFISAISLFENPEFEFFDQYVKIGDGRNYVRYIYDEPDNLILPPSGKPKMVSKDIEFDLSEKDFQLIHNAASSLQTPELCIVGEDNVLSLKATDTRNPTITNFSMSVGITDKEFSSVFNAQNFKFIQKDYHVTLWIDKFVEFSSNDLTYWIACRI